MVLKENKHYEIIPDKTDDQAWNVRILSGMFTETVLKYGVVKFNGKKKDMTFNFDIVYTPDTELTVSDLKLQEFAGIMLEQIMSQGFSNGEVITREIKDAN
tara:strand:+ start:1491 stop:1793 length:303 start_codon:yes stop_codon:yes gene_type:complete